MKTFKIIVGFILCWNCSFLQAQTVSLPDTNLRNKLALSYPNVIQNNKLVLSEAAALTGTLNLMNANISDASGIEYFTKITTLILSDNKLKTIPNISAITNLTNFYASNNQLISMPDFSSFTKLIDFQVMNNKIRKLPNFASPSVLASIYCSNNLLTDFPDLSQFPALKNLVIGKNAITQTFDFSLCPDLIELHVHQLGIDTIIGLDKLKKLSILYAWGNNIRNLSDLDSNTTLLNCTVFDNQLSKLPYLKNKPNLKVLAVANCKLTFESLNAESNAILLPTFTYSPQKPLAFSSVTAREEQNIAFSYPIPSALTNNSYVWKKNGVTVDSSASKTLTFKALKKTDAGNYILYVYNKDYPSLTLFSTEFRLDINPCVELSQTPLSFLDQDCTLGYTLDLSSIQIQGGNPPFSFTFNNDVESKKYNERQIIQLTPGKYTITVSDVKNCSTTQKQIFNKIENCDPVLTPNGDGITDSYFIEKNGTVKIYDLKRTLIKTLETPASWDGTNQAGTLMDAGYYILIPDGENPVYITIIR